MKSPNLVWYLPSFYGDIRLERVSNQETRLILVGLSSIEKIAVSALLKEARRTGITKSLWADERTLDKIDVDALVEQQLILKAPIQKVQKMLEKPMKPGRDSLSVVRYSNGRIEELTDKVMGLIEQEAEAEADDSDDAEVSAVTTTAVETAKPKAVAAVTVAQPTRGCPAPDFEAVELRANRVLEAFLTPQQLYDFRTEQAFLAIGADTGHKYAITSRNAPSKLARSFRSLFDLTEGNPYCVHDWTVPAAEEMLMFALYVQTPGHEAYLRSIPDDGRLVD